VSWSDLSWLGLQVRPLTDLRPECSWERSRFQAPLSKTVRQLATELRALNAKHIVLELDLRERDIRLDGFPRADAHTGSPAVVLSFESKYGPLRYATGEYDDWRDNLRAITLSMEALRAVDRYGVSKRGEQYRGWKALPPAATDPADAIQSVTQARAYLDERWGGDVRRALMETHPDRGGDGDEFRKVQRARELIGA
jgi:hypothetical protein